MAHSLSANDLRDAQPVGDFITGMRPVTVRDFLEQGAFQGFATRRRNCLTEDPHESVPQSQVDRLISDLMDIIVRATPNEGDNVRVKPTDPVAEGVALTMMQALLQRQVCSSY